MRVGRLEQLEKELQEVRGNQETELQVRHGENTHLSHKPVTCFISFIIFNLFLWSVFVSMVSICSCDQYLQ